MLFGLLDLEADLTRMRPVHVTPESSKHTSCKLSARQSIRALAFRKTDRRCVRIADVGDKAAAIRNVLVFKRERARKTKKAIRDAEAVPKRR
jgi:hypothetical protein